MISGVIDSWLDAAEQRARAAEPQLAQVLADYIGEARFGFASIEPALAELPPNSRILEVGAGSLLLTCGLEALGFRVTALEPVGTGFSHMDKIRKAVWECAAQHGCRPELLEIAAEKLTRESEFDFAFSINVMEHVEDVSLVLRRVWMALRPGAAYQFICPNYSFPYEPHFAIPTLFSKTWTERIFRARILNSRTVVDPLGTWQSLNWISVNSVRRTCRRQLGVEPEFDRDTCYRFVRRAIDDPSFQRRHSALLRSVCAALDAVGATTLLKLLPVGVQPALSCRVTRPLARSAKAP
jgi:2-polyprenyl-3-methyl-5-hydroxy-6-metoxy-1,4-benzoquinol methylase